MIEIFPIYLEANESREVAISGEYFEIRNAAYGIALIELMDRAGGMISRIKNPEQSDFVRPGRYETIRVSNGPTAQEVRLFIGSGDAGSRRTSGNVSVIDNGKAMTIANTAFIMPVGVYGIAGQFSAVELFNPVDSGINLIIENIEFSSNAAGYIGTGWTNQQLTELAEAGTSKKSGGAVSLAKKMKGNSVNTFTAEGAFTSYPVVADVVSFKNYKTPVVIQPGYGFLINTGSVGVHITAGFEYYEEKI